MANVKTVAQPTNEQTTNETNLPANEPQATNGSGEAQPEAQPEAEKVIPAFMLPILEAQKVENEANEAIKAELEAKLFEAHKAHTEAMLAAKFDYKNAAVIATVQAVTIASAELEAFDKKLAELDLSRELEMSLNTAKYDLCDKLELSMDKLNALIEAAKLPTDTLKSSFLQLFGKPALHIKAGVTGKSLAAQTSGAQSLAAQLSDGSNPEKVGSKRFEIYADLIAGLTFEQMLAKYPTYKKESNSYDYSTLNGTARTVISDNGFIKQADGSYKLSA